jgi:hypothetical protein
MNGADLAADFELDLPPVGADDVRGLEAVLLGMGLVGWWGRRGAGGDRTDGL